MNVHHLNVAAGNHSAYMLVKSSYVLIYFTCCWEAYEFHAGLNKS